MERFAKNPNFYLIDFFQFFAKRKMAENEENGRKRKWLIEKKIGVAERLTSVNPRKVTAMAICPIIVHFTT